MRHIAFVVDCTHGHINPILGIITELVNRGVRVTCAVTEEFSSRIADSGGTPVLYRPLDFDSVFATEIEICGDDREAIVQLWRQFELQELEDALRQLSTLYRDDRPDLIVYDLRAPAGKALASKWNIPAAEHSPQFIDVRGLNWCGRPYDESLVIASFPRIFQPSADALDHRFHFVGPSYNRRRFFQPWNPRSPRHLSILVSAASGSQATELFTHSIRAFTGSQYHVVLSIGSKVDPNTLGPLSDQFEINRSSSHLDILNHVSLLICQGGLGSSLEALYCGVPVLAVSPGWFYDEVAGRISDLGLGLRLSDPANIKDIFDASASILENNDILDRVTAMQKSLREAESAKTAADLLLSRLG